MSAFMDFNCTCGRRFGCLVDDDAERVVCPKCGREIDLTELNRQLDEARRSILDRPQKGGERQ